MGDGSTKGEIESVTKTPVSDDSVKLTWTLKEGSTFASYEIYVNGQLKGNTTEKEFTHTLLGLLQRQQQDSQHFQSSFLLK